MLLLSSADAIERLKLIEKSLTELITDNNLKNLQISFNYKTALFMPKYLSNAEFQIIYYDFNRPKRLSIFFSISQKYLNSPNIAPTTISKIW